MSETRTLKRCPFCGGSARAINGFFVRCNQCPAAIETFSRRDRSAIDLWNDRAPLPRESEATA